MIENNTEFQAAYEAGMAALKVAEVHGVPVAIIPQGATLKSFEDLLPLPRFKRGIFEFGDIPSLAAYVADHATPSTLVTVSNGGFLACIDGHDRGSDNTKAGNRAHSATLRFHQTPEWIRWTTMQKQKLAQRDFAEWLELAMSDVVEPVGANLVELISDLTAKSSVEFTSGVRVGNSGQEKLAYRETNEAATTTGNISVPTRLKLGLAPFKGTQKYGVTAVLRYRIADRKIQFWFELIDTHLIIEDAIAEMKLRFEKLTSLPVLIGA